MLYRICSHKCVAMEAYNDSGKLQYVFHYQKLSIGIHRCQYRILGEASDVKVHFIEADK